MQPNKGVAPAGGSFFTECAEVLKRVFTPSRALHKATLAIESTETGYIGLDKTYEFHNHIQTMNGEPFVADRKDSYLRVLVKSEPVRSSYGILRAIEAVMSRVFFFIPKPKLPAKCQLLPASLFKNAVEGETICLRQDRMPIAYTLKQQDPQDPVGLTFQEILRSVLEEAQTRNNYMYRKDVPEDELTFRQTLISPKAVILEGNSKRQAPNQESLNAFAKLMGSSSAETMKITWTQNEEKQTIRAEAPGILPEDLHFLIDGNRLYIAGERADLKVPDPNSYGDRPRILNRSLVFDKKIDGNSFEFSLKDGMLELHFRFS